MSQLHAAYLIDAIKELFEKTYFKEKINPLLKHLSCFEAATNTPLDTAKIHPQTAVVNNMITAGRPVRPSEYLEELYSLYLKRTEKKISSNKISYPFTDNTLRHEIEKSLYITDPRYTSNTPDEQDAKSQFNKTVIEAFIGATHKSFKSFFFTNKKPFSSIIPKNDNTLSKDESQIVKYIPDFIIELPIPQRGTKGLIIETDHETGMANMDYLGVEKKKEIAKRYGYKYIYVKNGQLHEAITEFDHFTFNEYFDQVRKNYNVPILGRNTGKDAMQYILSPIATARIQKIIIEFIFAGKLNPEAKKWSIGVVERDIPAAYIAFEDLRRRYNRVYDFQGVNKRFPEVELDIFTETEFENCKLHKASKKQTLNLENFDNKKEYDLLIDIAVLQYSNSSSNTPKNAAHNFVKIRSCHTKDTEHKFYLGKQLNFAPLEEKQEQNRSKAFDEILRDLFRIQSIQNLDKELIIKSIMREDFGLIHTPGKYIPEAEMIFALFHPGITVSVQPNDISLLSRFDLLRKKGIDAALYLNGMQHRLKDKKAAVQKAINQQALLLYVSVDFARNPFFEETINSIKKAGLNFSGIFINGITGVSEFSADFNPFYKGITNRLRKLLETGSDTLPVILTGTHCDYAVKEDIKADTGITNLIELKTFTPNFQIKLIKTKVTGLSETEEILKATEKEKQTALLELINKIPENDKILIIFPFKSSRGNYYSQNAEDGLKFLKEELPNEKISFFSETDIWENIMFNTEDYIESKRAYESFQNGSCRIMTATEQILHAVAPSGLRNIILYNMTVEPETLYKIINLFSSDSANNILYVLRDESELTNSELVYAATADGKQESMEQVENTDADRYVREQKVRLHFPGRKIDFEIVDEMLSSISLPDRNPQEELTQILWQEFELKTEVQALPKDNPTRIYVGKDNKEIGYFDFKIDMPNIDHSTINEEFALQILYFIREKAHKHPGGYEKYLDNFTQKNSAIQISGIEKCLEEMEVGASRKVKFYLRNNNIKTIHDLILQHAKTSIDIKKIELILDTSNSDKDFIDKISTFADLNVVNSQIDLPAAIQKLYLSYRNTTRTLLLISRLFDMGLIDDYTTDLNDGCIELQISRHTNSFYKSKLKIILSKYLSVEKAEEIFNNLDQYTGNTVIRKALNFFLNFLYDELREQSYKHIDSVGVWLDNLMKQNNSEAHKIELDNYFYTVFTAKYINSLTEHSLVNATGNFEGGSFNTVMDFIYKAEYLKNNIEHLYLSAEKAHKVYPDNYIVLLLSAFAGFRKFGSEEGFDKFFARLYTGFEAMEREENLDYEEAMKRRNLFLDLLYEYNKSLQEQTDPLIYLKIHTQKLFNFNKKFLQGFTS